MIRSAKKVVTGSQNTVGDQEIAGKQPKIPEIPETGNRKWQKNRHSTVYEKYDKKSPTVQHIVGGTL